MTAKRVCTGLALVLVAASMFSVRAADVTPTASTNAAEADAILRQMSEKLGAAQRFSFKADRKIDAEGTTEDGLPPCAEISIKVERPDKVVAHTSSRNTAARSRPEPAVIQRIKGAVAIKRKGQL